MKSGEKYLKVSPNIFFNDKVDKCIFVMKSLLVAGYLMWLDRHPHMPRSQVPSLVRAHARINQ